MFRHRKKESASRVQDVTTDTVEKTSEALRNEGVAMQATTSYGVVPDHVP
jgi:hypothetical protein